MGWSLVGSIQGPIGNTGTRGSDWFTGSGSPGTVSGAISGDFYLDTSGTGNYYKYNGSSWSLQGSLLGPTGPSSTWHAGSGVPASGLGSNGDMYLNDATGDVYGPKASGSWGSIVENIVGPSAPQATATTQGTIQLGSGDLGGTATAVTVPGKAPLASPALTGTPTAPTATAGTSTTQIATTAFVAGSFATLASPALTGTPTVPTATAGTSTTQIASTAFVATSFAPLASPALSGTPTVPTATAGTNTTQAASTAFVAASFAPLASPTFTGAPAVPTAASGTNTTQAASTAFVQTSALVTGGTTSMNSSQTSAFTASAGGFYPCSASSAAFTVTLPSAPSSGTRVTIMKTDTTTNAVTVTRGGSDVINVSGNNSIVLGNYLAAATLEYNSGTWYNQESSAPAHFTWLVQSGTRATGYGDLPEGIYIPQALEVLAFQFRIGTGDASGTSSAAIYTNTTNASTGSALSGASVSAQTWSTANSHTLVTGPWAIAAGTYLQCSLTPGATPGSRLYVDVLGVWL